jgi:hypothetical protein
VRGNKALVGIEKITLREKPHTTDFTVIIVALIAQNLANSLRVRMFVDPAGNDPLVRPLRRPIGLIAACHAQSAAASQRP